MSKVTRPSLTDYMLNLADVVATRSTCLRRKVGAVLTKDGQILSTGYNGAPAVCEHCSERGCLRQQLNIPSGERHEVCRGAHAEQNCIAQAAKHGVAVNGATLYCTDSPCSICAKSLINAGVSTIIFRNEYPDELAKTLLVEARVTLIQQEPQGDLIELPPQKTRNPGESFQNTPLW